VIFQSLQAKTRHALLVKIFKATIRVHVVPDFQCVIGFLFNFANVNGIVIGGVTVRVGVLNNLTMRTTSRGARDIVEIFLEETIAFNGCWVLLLQLSVLHGAVSVVNLCTY
jgi:hypothetical protein